MHDEIRRKLDLPISHLLSELGAELDEGKSLIPLSFEQLQRYAESWLQRMHGTLSEAICTDVLYDLYKDQEDRVLLAVAIADLISSLSLGVSPVTVSALLVRQGLIEFCKEKWKDKPKKDSQLKANID